MLSRHVVRSGRLAGQKWDSVRDGLQPFSSAREWCRKLLYHDDTDPLFGFGTCIHIFWPLSWLKCKAEEMHFFRYTSDLLY